MVPIPVGGHVCWKPNDLVAGASPRGQVPLAHGLLLGAGCVTGEGVIVRQ